MAEVGEIKRLIYGHFFDFPPQSSPPCLKRQRHKATDHENHRRPRLQGHSLVGLDGKGRIVAVFSAEDLLQSNKHSIVSALSNVPVQLYQNSDHRDSADSIKDDGGNTTSQSLSPPLFIPGMIDLHVHAPQFAFAGIATDAPLMEW